MRRPRFLTVAVVAVLVSAALGGMFGSSAAATQSDINDQLRVYSAALAAVQREYVEELPADRLVYASIDGLLKTLDPHSSFFEPRAYAAMRERQQGSYYGLGVTIASIDGDITIQAIFEGSPAYKKGIRRGDVIAKVGDESMKGWTTRHEGAHPDRSRAISRPVGTSERDGCRAFRPSSAPPWKNCRPFPAGGAERIGSVVVKGLGPCMAGPRIAFIGGATCVFRARKTV